MDFNDYEFSLLQAAFFSYILNLQNIQHTLSMLALSVPGHVFQQAQQISMGYVARLGVIVETNILVPSNQLTHWGRVTHICVGNLTIIGPDNGLSSGRRQAIIWTNAGILLIGPWGTNFNEILIGIHTFSFKKIHLKMSSAKRRPFCLGLNVLSHCNSPEDCVPVNFFHGHLISNE